jgi:hypothetical protein
MVAIVACQTTLRSRLQNMLPAYFGAWPSGKAPVFGTGIRGFESLRPSQVLANSSWAFTVLSIFINNFYRTS